MADQPEATAQRRLRFDYLKSQFFRVVHADGVVGGPSPNGNLTLSFFSERIPIPQQVVHAVTVDDKANRASLGEEIQADRLVREAIIREVDVAVVMDYNVAVALHGWLGNHLDALKSIAQSKVESAR